MYAFKYGYYISFFEEINSWLVWYVNYEAWVFKWALWGWNNGGATYSNQGTFFLPLQLNFCSISTLILQKESKNKWIIRRKTLP